MPRKIRISGEIGWAVQPDAILEQLDAAGGEDLEIEIASPGGSVFSGLEIYNALRGYKKENPKSQIMITITGLAASMASYIAVVDVADLVVAYDNAVFMVHNPWNLSIGDYREMKKNADFLEGLAGLLASAYVKRTGKDRADIQEMMNNETWLFGDQIQAAGFVDEIIANPDSEGDEDKASAVARAQMQFREMVRNTKDHEESPEKVAALMREVVTSCTPAAVDSGKVKQRPNASVAGNEKATPGKTGKGRNAMDLKELQAEHPETHAEAVETGVKKERERVASLVAMKAEKPYQGVGAVQEVIDEAIEKGKSPDETLGLVLATLRTNNTARAEGDNAPAIDTGGGGTASGETERAGGFESVEEV